MTSKVPHASLIFGGLDGPAKPTRYKIIGIRHGVFPLSSKTALMIGVCAISLLSVTVLLDQASSSRANEAAEDAAGTLVRMRRPTRSEPAPPQAVAHLPAAHHGTAGTTAKSPQAPIATTSKALAQN